MSRTIVNSINALDTDCDINTGVYVCLIQKYKSKLDHYPQDLRAHINTTLAF